MSKLNIDICQEPVHDSSAILVTLNGALENKTTPQLKSELFPLLTRESPYVVLDFGGITFINNTGMEFLVDMAYMGEENSSHYFLANVAAKIKVMLDSMGISDLFKVTDDLQIALGHISKKANSATIALSETSNIPEPTRFIPQTQQEKEFLCKVRTLIENGEVGLPLLSYVTLDLMSLSNHCNSHKLEKLIYNNPIVAGFFLKLANSAIHGSAAPVFAIDSVIAQLGHKKLRSIIMNIILRSKVIMDKRVDIFARKLCQYSQCCAHISRAIAAFLNKEERLVYSASLLCQIHKLILLNFVSDIVEKANYFPSQKLLNHLYQKFFLDILASVEEQWNFPPKLVMTIQGGHNFKDMAEKTEQMAIVSMAKKISEYIKMGNEYVNIELELAALKISPKNLETLLQKITKLNSYLATA